MVRSVAERVISELHDSFAGAVRPLAKGRSSSAWIVEAAGGQWVVRVPLPDSGRRPSYRSEALVGELFHRTGHPVAHGGLVEIEGVLCSVSRLLDGTPVEYGWRWTEDFGSQLASMLYDLHGLSASGWGPLADGDHRLQGIGADSTQGIVDRWFHASVWPFDNTRLEDHPLIDLVPDLLPDIAMLERRIREAAQGSAVLVHSDLHREHLLRGDRGTLAGLLDFGDAFVGCAAWDFALLHWYYSEPDVDLVAGAYPGGTQLSYNGRLLAVAVGLYKLAKDPTQGDVAAKIRRRIEALSTTL